MLAFIGLLLLNLCSVASAILEPCDVSLFARSYIAVMQYNTVAMVDGNQSSMAALNVELDAIFTGKIANKSSVNKGRMFYTMNFEHLLVTIVNGGMGVDVGLISVKEMAERKSVQIEEIAFGKPENRICGGKTGAFRPSSNYIHFNDRTYVQIDINARTLKNASVLSKCQKYSQNETIFTGMGEKRKIRYGELHLDQMETGKFYIKTSAERGRYFNVLVSEDSNLSSCTLREYPRFTQILGRMLIVPKNGGSRVDFVFEKPITSRVFQTTTTEASLNTTSLPDSELDLNSTSISSREERVDSTTMSILSSRERVEIQGEKVKIVIEGKRVKNSRNRREILVFI